MSFWKLIGLADADDIKGLQEELSQLKSENLKLHQQQETATMLLQKEILQTISELSRIIKATVQETGDSFDVVQHSLEEGKASQLEMLKRLLQVQDQIGKSQNAVSQDIVDIKAYLNSLWEATKLVWVDDLLKSLESE